MTTEPIAAHDVRATIDYRGNIAEPGRHDPTYQRDTSPAGDFDSPDFGPGHERTPHQVVADSQNHHPSLHDLTYTIAPRGTWNEDTMSGVHAFPASEGVEAHYGYMEPWGIELPNDRAVDIERVVPWDHGLGTPALSANMRV